MIAPGEIRVYRKGTSGRRHLTATITTAGLQLIITGQSVQHIAVHTTKPQWVIDQLKNAKSLRDFAFKSRERTTDV